MGDLKASFQVNLKLLKISEKVNNVGIRSWVSDKCDICTHRKNSAGLYDRMI